MNLKDFFSQQILRTKFSSSNRQAVKFWLSKNGWISGGEISTNAAAAAIILLSFFEDEDDLEIYARKAIFAPTDRSSRPEKLVQVLGYILSHELNANTIQNLIFDRTGAKVIANFIDGKSMAAGDLSIVLTPAWAADGVVKWDRMELISMALDLAESEHVGVLVNDMNEYLKQFSEN